MRVVETVEQVRAARAAYPQVGLVPTMGALHDGHLDLVRRAKMDGGAVIVSIFVNPRQFGAHEDLDAYPRDLPGDLALLQNAGVDLVWTPTREHMYPAGFATTVTVGGLTTVLEGAHRPGHFDGVTTVVAKLFAVLAPQRAYFGQKDAQQVAVIRALITDLAFPIEMVVVPTRREPDGLAMSSRNAYLNPQERQAARVLFQALRGVEQLWEQGQSSAEVLRSAGLAVLAQEPLARVDYLSVADPRTLTELSVVSDTDGAIASTAVRIGRTRLIDNVTLAPRTPHR